MAGHSKWANIQHRKGKQDAKRGKLFTKLIREITVAAQQGGGDANANPRLRAAILAARGANMTADTIDRAVKRGAGGLEGNNLEEIRYEGYGPGGVAVMVDCMTDNRNRTVAEVRHAFTKCGGNLGTDGSVSYLFTKAGQLLFSPDTDEDKLMEVALDAGADDVMNEEDGSAEVRTSPEAFEQVIEKMKAVGLEPVQAEVTMLASTSAPVSMEDAEKVERLIDMLEDLDDVQNVYTNVEFPEQMMAG